MSLKLSLSVALASLLFSAPVLAGQDCPSGKGSAEHRAAKMQHRQERMEKRMSRAVENGRLTREQADQFLAESRQLHEEMRVQREAGGGKLTPEQKEQFHQRRQALREKMRANLKDTGTPRI